MLITLFALLAAAAHDPGGRNDMAQRCARPGATTVDDRVRTARPRKLGEELPAKQFLTVLREVDGCPKPVVLRENIGGPAR